MIKVLLAGQPNCGKSTIFNMISGIRQHIANYPGVTVDKKSGFFSYDGEDIELIDLPGIYSFSSFSLEERVAKEAILNEDPDLIINVVDASNLKRNLYLSFQLLEIGKPVIIVFNMMDVAKRRGIQIDTKSISKNLACPIIEANGSKGEGKEEILKTIVSLAKNKKLYTKFKINYEELEPFVKILQDRLANQRINSRWLCIKALEKDEFAFKILGKYIPNIKEISLKLRDKFTKKTNQNIESFLATFRYDNSEFIYGKYVKEKKSNKNTLSEKIDNIVLNRWLAFPFLFLIIFLVYELSIVFGYKLTDYTWPILAGFKNFAISILPSPDLTKIPILTDFGIWLVNSANALLNYIPIFFILFALIAIMEDVGYMPRIAFILDRIFRKFGLHGQSTLPLVLGGAFVGGCAVPGVMSTKGIADDRARMATILSVPLMNCLAKVPFYTLLLGAFFKDNISIMMFYISTITIFTALIMAKLMTFSILKTRQSAPFVMELPPYHLPTFKGIILRAFERVWLYIKKVVTIVLAVAVILFVLLQFPGISDKRQAYYEMQSKKALMNFDRKVNKSDFYRLFDTREEVSKLLNYYDAYKSKKMMASSKNDGKSIDAEFKKENAIFYKIVKGKDKDLRSINRALRSLSKDRNKILRNIKKEKVENSILGMIGRSIEPISKYAGFDWRINVAFLSSFVARESAVATLGSLYENNKANKQRAEEALLKNSGYIPLHATAIIIFMLLTPPCIATMIVIKIQTNSYIWMLFATLFPMALGLVLASFVFTLGNNLGWSGLEAMSYYYFTTLFATITIGLFPSGNINWSGGLIKIKPN
ncbi:MAG: ferrous iron transport protein B [Proteobacteria bacterium]|nr:MAG: ferrous iron transport protein B [Pseudomonadota bacterium]